MRLLIPLFSPATGTWGGLTRVLAIAQAAERAGHSVAFCASGYLEKTLLERGYRVYPVPAATMLGLPRPLSQILVKRSQNASIPVRPGKSFGNIWFVQVLSGMARAGYLRQVVKVELAAMSDFNADGLVTDLDLGAYLAASIGGIPIASAYQQVMSEGKGSLFWKVVHTATKGVLKTYARSDIPPDELAFGPQVLKIIPSIPELEGADPNRADICYVGQLLGEISPSQKSDFLAEESCRYLFVYVGTGSVTQAMLRNILPAVLARNPSLRAIVGGVNITSPETVQSVEFRPYISANALLPHCDWTICHGGQNTIIQSLVHGVPLLVFPGPIFERRFNASKIQESGAGLMGELTNFNCQWLQSALEKRSDYSINAKALGKKIGSMGGADQAIQAISRWVDSKKTTS
jgi:UDP:flavonoid glycosyltransferase YjiC (YdhE family)